MKKGEEAENLNIKEVMSNQKTLIKISAVLNNHEGENYIYENNLLLTKGNN
jgi:hypothetical protein